MSVLLLVRPIFFLLLCVGPLISFAESEQEMVVHPVTGWAFPVNLGSFQRVSQQVYNGEQTNLSAAYSPVINDSVHISVYVSPVPSFSTGTVSTLSEHFSYEEFRIFDHSPNTRPLAWPELNYAASLNNVENQFAAYDLGGRAERVSLLQLFDYGEWRLKVRVSYRWDNSKKAKIYIDEFMQIYPWPGS